MAVKALNGTKESQRDMDGYVNRQRLHDNCCVPVFLLYPQLSPLFGHFPLDAGRFQGLRSLQRFYQVLGI